MQRFLPCMCIQGSSVRMETLRLFLGFALFHLLSAQSLSEGLEKDFNQWLLNLKDPQFEAPYDEEPSSTIEPSKKLIEVVPCDQQGSIWGYKYAGNKGKRKMFKGKGKITFVKSDVPPHGYDYGMKSGHCLIKNDLNIKSIETTFDDKDGSYQGLTIIDYFDGKRVKGLIKNGVMHGFTRYYEDELDEETNLAKVEKRLAKIQVVNNWQAVGPKWQFNLNGIMVFQNEVGENTVIFVPFKNESTG